MAYAVYGGLGPLVAEDSLRIGTPRSSGSHAVLESDRFEHKAKLYLQGCCRPISPKARAEVSERQLHRPRNYEATPCQALCHPTYRQGIEPMGGAVLSGQRRR